MNAGKSWNPSSQTVVVLIAICLVALFYLGYKNGSKAPDAPLIIMFRPSAISGLVMQVHNTGGNYLSCALTVVNSLQGQRQNYSFSLPPHGEQEVGLLECKWQFEHGERGNIQVLGYTTKEFTVP